MIVTKTDASNPTGAVIAGAANADAAPKEEGQGVIRTPASDPSLWMSFSDSKSALPKAAAKPTTNAELWARRQAVVPRGVASATQIFAARAENAYLWDVEGRRYIDFGGGIGVLNTGHRNPRVMERALAQMDRFTHTAFQVVGDPGYIELDERLCKLAPGSDPKQALFLTTGAEAVENAIKIARAATKRTGIIAFEGGFHGRTMMALACTGKVAPYKKGFGPFPPETYHVQFPNPFRGITTEDAMRDIEALFKSDIDPERVAAIIFEPVQGEGGFNVAPFDFLKKLRELCDRHGILLIADEVQSGFARTGKMFAIEHSGVVPDLITVAKSLAGGFPLSAVIGKAKYMDAVQPGGLGGTYAGFPVAIQAGLGVLEAIEGDGLLDRSTQIGDRMRSRLEEMAKDIPAIGDVRGLGGMIAVELVKDRKTNAPDPELTKKVTAKAAGNGLVLLSCGTEGNVLRILVPLTAKDEVIDEGLAILERSLKEATA
jgi:4-aminobutyrate aminotransferase/(S)-3-amino-2-methylpropionate transaminase